MPRHPRRRPPPKLTPTFFDDHEKLLVALDDMLAVESDVRPHARRIRVLQSKLRGLVDDRAWRVYMNIEQAANARAVVEMKLLIEWLTAKPRRGDG